MDPAAPRRSYLAVKNGRFVAVRSNARSGAYRRGRAFDAKRLTIVPGFVDCPSHAGGEIAPLRAGRQPVDVEFVSIQASSKNCARRRARRRRAHGSGATSSTIRSLTDKRALNVHDPIVSRDHRRRPPPRRARRSTTARRSRWPASRRDEEPPGGTYDRDLNGDRTAASPAPARGVFSVGRRPAPRRETRSVPGTASPTFRSSSSATA